MFTIKYKRLVKIYYVLLVSFISCLLFLNNTSAHVAPDFHVHIHADVQEFLNGLKNIISGPVIFKGQGSSFYVENRTSKILQVNLTLYYKPGRGNSPIPCYLGTTLIPNQSASFPTSECDNNIMVKLFSSTSALPLPTNEVTLVRYTITATDSEGKRVFKNQG